MISISAALRRGLVLAGMVGMVGGVLPAAPASAADKYRDAEWWLSALHLTQAWQVSEGAGVKIAVLDTGVDATYPDLTNVVVGGTDVSGLGAPNGQKPIGEATPGGLDYSGHGTGMAVFMAGRGHGPGHSEGMLGSAPAASVLSISSNDQGNQDHDAFVWAVAHGAKVINMSFIGGVTASDVAYAEAHDVVLVAGAGNDGTEGLGEPANFFGVVAVAGVDQNGQGDLNSTYGGPGNAGGFAATGGVAVAAPDSPNMPTPLLVKDGEYTFEQGGTSDSTAIVSGIVALIRAKFPHMDAANVINRLITTADRPKGSGAYDAAHGFGIPDAYKALTANVPSVCENPLGTEIGHPADSDGAGAWQGGWQSILTHKNLSAYQPKCPTTSPSSSAPVSTPPASSSTPTAAASTAPPAGASTTANSTAPAAPGQGVGPGSSSSTPVGLIAGLSGLGVLVLAAILVYATRIRPRRTASE